MMATAPWWWVPLITLIGTPLLGALLYFVVPLARVAKRLGISLSTSNPPWWVQNIFAALLVGGIVAVASIKWQESLSEDQARQATRLENLRFVRQLSAQKDVVARPFSEFDLQGQNLADLDLRGAVLEGAELQHANLNSSNLSPSPKQPSDLAYANLAGAYLLLTNLSGASLTALTLKRPPSTGPTSPAPSSAAPTWKVPN